MRCVLALALCGSVLMALPAIQVQPKPVPAKQKTTKPAPRKSATVSRKLVNGRWVRVTRTARAKPGPSYQVHPDPDRYQEIQKALADRGYFKGEANGQWNDDSVDALKRFQADQKLTDDGKINSLSLIGLGLGPKHNGTAVTPPAPGAPSDN